MQSLFNFIVEPKNKRYENEVDIDNKKLIVNTTMEDHKYVSRIGVVKSIPKIGETNSEMPVGMLLVSLVSDKLVSEEKFIEVQKNSYDELTDHNKENVEVTKGFQEAFAKRGKTDYRKWAEFLNLAKGFARLKGRQDLDMEDVEDALGIFQDSLETLCKNFTHSALQSGLNYEEVALHKHLLQKFDNDKSGRGTGKKQEVE